MQFIEVYEPSLKFLYILDKQQVKHCPAVSDCRRRVICRHSVASTGCRLGDKCQFVHAKNLQHARRMIVHDKWGPIRKNIVYPTHNSTEAFHVESPSAISPKPFTNGVLLGERCEVITAVHISGENVIITNGSRVAIQSGKRATVCPDFYFNERCYRGHACEYIHLTQLPCLSLTPRSRVDPAEPAVALESSDDYDSSITSAPQVDTPCTYTHNPYDFLCSFKANK